MTFQFGCSRKTYQPESATPAACVIRAEVDENGNFTAIKTENNELGTNLDLNIWLHRKEEKYKLQLVIIFKGLWWGMEMAAYDITPEQLKGITYAEEVKCKVKKREYSLSASNFECFHRFYEKHVKDKEF
jgi:hypothetical protein